VSYIKQQPTAHILDAKHFDLVEHWGASRRGTTFEAHFWTPALRHYYGNNILYIGGKQRTLTLGNLRATPDALLINRKRNALKYLGVDDIGPSGEIVLECKTVDPRIKLSEAKFEHVFQAQTQIGMFRAVTDHKPNYALISYVNASFFDDVIEFAIEFDPDIFERAKQRAAMILHATDPGQLKPEGWIAGGRECEYCPFLKPCTALRGAVVERESDSDADPKLVVEISTLARRERDWGAKSSAAQEQQRYLQEQIKSLLREHGRRRIAGDGVSVIWSPVKGRPSFDMPALREAAAKLGLNVQKFETVGDPTDRLTITVTEAYKEAPTPTQNLTAKPKPKHKDEPNGKRSHDSTSRARSV
jgi:hypothetical protein